jgi:hypothetical protein
MSSAICYRLVCPLAVQAQGRSWKNILRTVGRKCQRAAQFGGANDPFILVTASGKVNFRGASFAEFPHLFLNRDAVLSQIHAAVDVQHVPSDVGGFVARQKDDGGGDVASHAQAAQRNTGF